MDGGLKLQQGVVFRCISITHEDETLFPLEAQNASVDNEILEKVE